MDLFDLNPDLLKYIEDHTSPEEMVLAELRRYTFLRVVNPRMISGQVQGKFLEMISKLIHPERILEIGTYTGYSAICLARGLRPGGELITIEINDELEEIQSGFFKKAGLSHFIQQVSGNALEIIPNLKGSFDLVFIDGDKEQYPEYYRLSLPLLKKGGLIIADNVLWDGKVFDKAFRNDPDTKAIIKFNEMVNSDRNTENIILPLRDGLMLIRKL